MSGIIYKVLSHPEGTFLTRKAYLKIIFYTWSKNHFSHLIKKLIFWSGVKNDFFKKCLPGEKTSNFSFFQKKLTESEKKSFLYFSRINHQILRGLRQKKCFHDFYFLKITSPKKKCLPGEKGPYFQNDYFRSVCLNLPKNSKKKKT